MLQDIEKEKIKDLVEGTLNESQEKVNYALDLLPVEIIMEALNRRIKGYTQFISDVKEVTNSGRMPR